MIRAGMTLELGQALPRSIFSPGGIVTSISVDLVLAREGTRNTALIYGAFTGGS